MFKNIFVETGILSIETRLLYTRLSFTTSMSGYRLVSTPYFNLSVKYVRRPEIDGLHEQRRPGALLCTTYSYLDPNTASILAPTPNKLAGHRVLVLYSVLPMIASHPHLHAQYPWNCREPGISIAVRKAR